MKFCKSCNKKIEPREETHHDLCIDCYTKYLYEKITELAKEESTANSSDTFFGKINNFIKKLFRNK